ncbi:transposase [Eoetvoesiella caeni]
MSESSTSLAPVLANPRRRYSVDFKRQVVQESMVSGMSIARVAMTHGLNTNPLHNWRWQYRRGDFGPLTETPALLPIHINAQPATARHLPTADQQLKAFAPQGGRIELHLGEASIVVHGEVNLSGKRPPKAVLNRIAPSGE